MTHQPSSTRKRHRADEHRSDEELERGWVSHKRYENTTARDQSRQHNGDHYANINIYHGAANATNAPKSPELDPVEEALKRLMFKEMDARYLAINSALAPSSCRWLFERPEYQRWRDSDYKIKHHGFLWLKGKAGAGKSTLMKYLFDDAVRTRLAGQTFVAFFFNARGASVEKSLEGMFRALLYQILHEIPRLQHLLIKKRTLSAQSQDFSLSGLQSVLRDVVENLASESLTCYVDALDECTGDDVGEMVSFFEDLGEHAVDSGTQFHVCFASRHYPHISIGRSECLVLEDENGHKEDISTYVERKLKISNERFKREMCKKIEERASGVFLWVMLVVRVLNDECARGNIHLVRTRLKEIPTGLTDLIRNILQRDPPTKYLVPLLQWILFSERPLSRKEVFLALHSIEPETIKNSHTPEALTRDNIDSFILHTSKGLVETTKGGSRVQFIHEFVRTHFLDDGGLVRLQPSLRTNFVGQSHDQLKQCCHNYLFFKPRRSRTNSPATIPRIALEKSTKSRFETIDTFEFLEYAFESVLHHANVAHADGTCQRDFMTSFPLDIWIEWEHYLLESTDHHGRYTVSTAYILAEQGHAALLPFAMVSLPEADYPDEKYRSLLGAAVESGDPESIRAILEHDGYGHSLGKGGEGCMSRAIRRGKLEIVEALVEGKAMPFDSAARSAEDFRDPKKNAVFLAASKPQKFSKSLGRFGLLRLVCTSLSRVELKNKKCAELLEFALEQVCKLGDTETFHFLRAKGAVPSMTILRRTCDAGYEELVQLILQTGIHLEANPLAGSLLATASRAGHENIIRLLLKHGANIETLDQLSQLTALQSACKYGQASVVRFLIASKAAINDRVRVMHAPLLFPGDTPLLVAIRNEFTEVARLLIEEGADIHCICYKGKTALWSACFRGNEAIVRLLIERDANVHVQDSSARSALSVARERGHTAIVRLLIEGGAS